MYSGNGRLRNCKNQSSRYRVNLLHYIEKKSGPNRKIKNFERSKFEPLTVSCTLLSKIYFPLWSHPNPGDYDLNKLEPTIILKMLSPRFQLFFNKQVLRRNSSKMVAYTVNQVLNFTNYRL